MYFCKIFEKGSGLTNQIFSLITSIIIAYKNNHKVVVIDYFLDDYSLDNYTPITQIFDIEQINIFLKNTYDIIIIDKYNIDFELYDVLYGNKSIKIDITNHILKKFYKNNILFINKNTILNDICGDPCPNVIKQLFICYKINNYIINEVYNEHLKEDISFDYINSEYINTFNWINSHNIKMFEDILVNLKYNVNFIEKSNLIINNMINYKYINVIHLRIEDDAIKHWSKMNNMDQNTFKIILENKYINLIKTYINKDDLTIILSQSLSNNIINFLSDNDYNYTINEKFFNDREKNAIIDLLVSQQCNNIFIGNFNFKHLNGSTFSYYISKLLNNVKKIAIDLDRIIDEYYIY
jgi:hypothetical protein